MPGPAPTLPPGMTGSDVNDRAPTYAGSLDAAETPKCNAPYHRGVNKYHFSFC
jgi:hypothetical protein